MAILSQDVTESPQDAVLGTNFWELYSTLLDAFGGRPVFLYPEYSPGSHKVKTLLAKILGHEPPKLPQSYRFTEWVISRTITCEEYPSWKTQFILNWEGKLVQWGIPAEIYFHFVTNTGR